MRLPEAGENDALLGSDTERAVQSPTGSGHAY